ncbi:MAG TPA: TonB-dependent receptor [Agitococcus sp.]|nr:TonB-dependent receptor [Pseudomonadales bacterium]HQV21694.1 TonB-dependent receptor [Agitococcus sp.]
MRKLVAVFAALFVNVSYAAYEIEDLLYLSLADLAKIPVVTAARTSQQWGDVQGSLWVMTAQDIRDRGYRHLGDVLRDLPSVDLQGPTDNSSRLTVRGVTGNAKLLVLQDGVRIGATAGEVIPVSINYPLYMAKQVEVLLTAGSALYGTDAVVGVVNIISQTPSSQGEQALHGEANESNNQLNLLLKGSIGHRPIVLGVHRENNNNQQLAQDYPDIFQLNDLYDIGQKTVLVPANNRQKFQNESSAQSVWARMTVSPDVELGASYRQLSYANDYTTLPSATDYGGFLDEEFLSLYARYQQNFGQHINANTLLSWSSYQLNKNSYYNNVFSNYQAGYKYADSQRVALDSQWTYQVNNQHQLITGLIFEHLDAIPRTADLSKPYNNNVSAAEQHLYYMGTNNSLPIKIFNVVQDNFALFVQDQYQWSPQWRTQIGARIDKNSDFGQNISSYLGLKYYPSTQANFSLTYSEAFLAPSPSLSYEHFGSFSGQQNAQGLYTASSFRIPNTELEPETAKSLELLFNYLPNTQQRWTAVAYVSRVQDLILYAADTPQPQTNFIEGGFIAQTKQRINLGDSLSSGIELSSRYRCAFEWGNIDLWATYSFTEGTLTSDKGKETLPYTARHKFKLASTLRWKEGVFVTPSFYLIDESHVPNSAANNGRSLVSPAYGVVNIYAGYDHIIEGVNGFLRIENLTSRPYYNAGGSADVSLVKLPQLKRTVSLGVELEF